MEGENQRVVVVVMSAAELSACRTQTEVILSCHENGSKANPTYFTLAVKGSSGRSLVSSG